MTQIEYNLPDYDYHDKEIFPHISSSDVKTVLSKSLLHWAGQERKESIAFDIGKAVHALILEPEKDLVCAAQRIDGAANGRMPRRKLRKMAKCC